MRLRNIKGAREKIASNEYTITEPAEYKGRWRELFGNENPVHIEIGMGKGRFIMELSEKNSKVNYIGIEKYSSVLIRALEKRAQSELDNLLFVRMDAEDICDVFEPREVERVYLNFSDPWPKDRHAKRRLTSTRFLDRYKQILKKDGQVIFKTDNRELFDFSLEQVREAGWILEGYTYDLHNSPYKEGNIMTEYEEKFSSQGTPINYMVITVPSF